MKKLAGQPYQTEYAMPVFDRTEPAAAIEDIRTRDDCCRHVGRYRAAR